VAGALPFILGRIKKYIQAFLLRRQIKSTEASEGKKGDTNKGAML